ncbi:lysine--tRNA ligase [Candidatus Woesearchaeota archaeon]|nr:lysine--tRNA ligase [Candidatus Woesearchaeota archaeon]
MPSKTIKEPKEEAENFHWTKAVIEKIKKEHGNKKSYVCASGISPSGYVHIGHFREILTSEFVAKALRKEGKQVRFIYSWDNYDRFRKVPLDIPKEFEKYIGLPISEVPDPWKCHKSFAEHFEKTAETDVKQAGIEVEFIDQSKMYKSCKYADDIKKALLNKAAIKKILNKYRKEPLENDWYPTTIYCEKCNKDNTKILDYDNNYTLSYECTCGYSGKINFKKVGNVKLLWRVDWPMRWHYEQVSFEPGGKDHSSPGSSYETGKQILPAIWGNIPPTYQVYEWIGIKGLGGKMSSSKGKLILPRDAMEIYEPEIIKWLFAGTRPNREFSIGFDLDVLKIYEDFDKCESIYYKETKLENKKEYEKQKDIYELSVINLEKKKPERPPFRHLVSLVQMYEGDLKKIEELYPKNKYALQRAKCALNWINNYAPDQVKFSVHKEVTKEILNKLTVLEKQSIQELSSYLEKNIKKIKEEELFNKFYEICTKYKINNQEFFKAVYLILIGKERGPRLAGFLLLLNERAIKLLKQVK